MLAHRYALIHQRILRHELFRPTDLGHSRSSKAVLQHKLTPVESLLGKSSAQTASSTLLLLGILIQIEEGQYYLEDPSGQVLLSFQDCIAVDGFFVTESCILLVEGNFQDGILYVQRMGHPLLETRETSLKSIQQQVFHPSFALKNNTMPESDSSIVLLADLHLDQPSVLQQLEGLLATYENYSPYRLPLFCFQGNFLSTDPALRSSNQNTSIRQALEELATLIAKYPNLARNAHFVLVPGPNDGVGHVLPLPPLTAPQSFGQKVTHVHWGSNPTRITWSGREMVVFRYDLLHLLQREQVLLQEKATPEELNDEDAMHRRQPHCRLVKTILDQGHLVPVQNVPVYWNYDHALSLYPLPDSLVLAGDASSAYHEVYGGCDVIHPGSLAGQGSYAVYSPTVKDRNDRDNDDDDDDDSIDSHVQAQRVELCQLGDENGRQCD
jgi:DNA polymerase epsilon subunit 2